MWEANLLPHLTAVFLTGQDDYNDAERSDECATHLEEALASLTRLATITTTEIYPTKAQHRATKFNWKSLFAPDQPTGDLLHHSTWAHHAIRVHTSLLEHHQMGHLNTHVISHRLQLLANPPDSNIKPFTQANLHNINWSTWIKGVRLALKHWNRCISWVVCHCHKANYNTYITALADKGTNNTKDL